MAEEKNKIFFYGSNWDDLDRLVALSRFHFIAHEEFNILEEDGTTPRAIGDRARAGYLAGSFRGPALDWVVSVSNAAPDTLASFTGFVVAVKQHFGIDDETTQILRRGELERLTWSSDVSVFFAEFDRITFSLGILSDEAKIAHVIAKCPPHIKKLLAEQALNFNNYFTMRARLTTMWALGAFGQVKPTCSKCGKKGHSAADCRGSSKN